MTSIGSIRFQGVHYSFQSPPSENDNTVQIPMVFTGKEATALKDILGPDGELIIIGTKDGKELAYKNCFEGIKLKPVVSQQTFDLLCKAYTLVHLARVQDWDVKEKITKALDKLGGILLDYGRQHGFIEKR